MTDTEVCIVLDRMHRALRSGERWAVQRFQPNGEWDMVDNWNGGRRSLLQWCANHDVHPGREAEAILATMPESTGWRDR